MPIILQPICFNIQSAAINLLVCVSLSKTKQGWYPFIVYVTAEMVDVISCLLHQKSSSL